MIRRPGPPSQRWRTFVRNHLAEIVAIDFFTVPTANFRTLYVFVVLSLDRRRIVHLNVTESPTAAWASLQLLQAFPFDTAPRFLIRDRDSIHGETVAGGGNEWLFFLPMDTILANSYVKYYLTSESYRSGRRDDSLKM
jgi:hypothetical protein